MLRVADMEADTRKIWMWTSDVLFKEYFDISPRSCQVRRPKTIFAEIVGKLNDHNYKIFKYGKLDNQYIFVYYKENDVELVNIIDQLKRDVGYIDEDH